MGHSGLESITSYFRGWVGWVPAAAGTTAFFESLPNASVGAVAQEFKGPGAHFSKVRVQIAVPTTFVLKAAPVLEFYFHIYRDRDLSLSMGSS